MPSVNSTMKKTAPKGAVSQLGHSLGCIIHAFATADECPTSLTSRMGSGASIARPRKNVILPVYSPQPMVVAIWYLSYVPHYRWGGLSHHCISALHPRLLGMWLCNMWNFHPFVPYMQGQPNIDTIPMTSNDKFWYILRYMSTTS